MSGWEGFHFFHVFLQWVDLRCTISVDWSLLFFATIFRKPIYLAFWLTGQIYKNLANLKKDNIITFWIESPSQDYKVWSWPGILKKRFPDFTISSLKRSWLASGMASSHQNLTPIPTYPWMRMATGLRLRVSPKVGHLRSTLGKMPDSSLAGKKRTFLN